jgi:transaldolase
VLADLEQAGVDYDDLTDTLEREGVAKFADSFDELMQSLASKREALAPA